MGLVDRAKRIVSRLLTGVEADCGGGTGGEGKRVVRLARLPTRIFADGSIARGVASEGLYGLARLTIHEAELSLDGRDGEPGSADSVSHPYNNKSKYYAVVSLGRQTFASKRMRRMGDRPPSGGAGAGTGAAPLLPPAAAAASEGAAVFRWDEGTDVVLQRSGATVAQVAIYKAGRIDGALGDSLQCWCTLDLAPYFTEAEAADADRRLDAAAAPPADAPPPALLITADGGSSTASEMHLSPSEEVVVEDGQQRHAALHERVEGLEQHPGVGSPPPSPALPADGGSGSGRSRSGRRLLGLGSRQATRRTLPAAGSGEVLQDVWLPLVDPGDAAAVRGRLRLTVRAATVEGMEQQLWRRLLPLADLDGDGRLTLAEFGGLLEAMGSDLSPEEAHELFAAADTNGDGVVDAQELAAGLTACHQEGEFARLMTRCPVDGAELLPNDDVANVMYVTLALDGGTGESLRGGYTTPEQVSRSWLLSMTEWATQPLAGSPKALLRGNKYRAGRLRQGAAAAHILIFDRRTKRVVEEAVSPALTLAMRALYQSRAGKVLLGEGALKQMRKMTDKYGAYADSPESAADIPKFLSAFRGQVDMREALAPSLSAYKTFNAFFYRKLKPEARPIAAPADPRVLVSAADCRLMVYGSVGDATRCWIKGKRFSLAGLLADTAAGTGAAASVGAAAGDSSVSSSKGGAVAAEEGSEAEEASEAGGGGDGAAAAVEGTAGAAAKFEGGSMAVFRLAPQDYHRFHLPVGGTVLSLTDVPGELMTVNPIAVNSPFADVFTCNQRSVLLLQSPDFGLVAYVAIGATVVGSIIWTAEVGQELSKGAEAGYFAFGGSTIVCLFQAGAVEWDGDLVQNSLSSMETRVLMGERLGRRSGGGDGDMAPDSAAVPA